MIDGQISENNNHSLTYLLTYLLTHSLTHLLTTRAASASKKEHNSDTKPGCHKGSPLNYQSFALLVSSITDWLLLLKKGCIFLQFDVVFLYIFFFTGTGDFFYFGDQIGDRGFVVPWLLAPPGSWRLSG